MKFARLFPSLSALLSIVLLALSILMVRYDQSRTHDGDLLSMQVFMVCVLASLVLACGSIVLAGMDIGPKSVANLRAQFIGLLLGIVAALCYVAFLCWLMLMPH